MSRRSATSRTSRFTGVKFNDINGNGIFDPNEPPLPNFAFQLINAATGQVLAQTSSNATGNFAFADRGPLPNGASYRIREVVPAGWIQTTPNPPDFPAISGMDRFVLFGNFQGVTVNGTVYLDSNSNGTRNPGEPGLPGFTIQLFRNGVLVGTGISIGDGSYSIPLVGPGTYQLIERPREGFIVSAPPGGIYTFVTFSGTNLLDAISARPPDRSR